MTRVTKTAQSNGGFEDLDRDDLIEIAKLDRLKLDQLIVQRVRGERSETLLVRCEEVDCGHAVDAVWYRQISRKQFEALKVRLPVKRRTLVDVPESPMCLLLNCLGLAFDRQDFGRPDWISAEDWQHDLQKAEARLNGRVGLDIGNIYSAIIPRIKIDGGMARQVLCHYCHTPILFGYRLNGREIRRRKDGHAFCDGVCKMNRRREDARRRRKANQRHTSSHRTNVKI